MNGGSSIYPYATPCGTQICSTDGGITIKWASVDGADHYEIWYSQFSPIDTPECHECSWIDAGQNTTSQTPLGDTSVCSDDCSVFSANIAVRACFDIDCDCYIQTNVFTACTNQNLGWQIEQLLSFLCGVNEYCEIIHASYSNAEGFF